MSKGTITGGGEDGLYSVTIERENGDVISDSAWCADLTEDLSGSVGIIEIAGDRDKGINIQPGYEGNAAYNATRDGELYLVPQAPSKEGHQAGVYWNWAMRPGWQKWKPNYRYGTITGIDYEADTCDVVLDACLATDTPDGKEMDVNQSSSLSGVTIEYMSCNSAAFEVGDEVLVKFEENEWGGAKVIGFKEEPKGCWKYIYVVGYHLTKGINYCTVLDIRTGEAAVDIPNAEEPITFPCPESDLATWLSEQTELVFTDLFTRLRLDESYPTPVLTSEVYNNVDETTPCDPPIPCVHSGYESNEAIFKYASSAETLIPGKTAAYVKDQRTFLEKNSQCSNPCVTMLRTETFVDEIKTTYAGYRYTAVNGSGEVLDVWTETIQRHQVNTEWDELTDICGGTVVDTYTFSGTHFYLTIPGYELVKEALDYDPGCDYTMTETSFTGDRGRYSDYQEAAYNEGMKAFFQLFMVYQNVDLPHYFHTYVTAGFAEDLAVSPSTLPKHERFTEILDQFFTYLDYHRIMDVKYF